MTIVRTMRRMLLLLAVGALTVAGCGGSETTAGSSAAEIAGIVPASAPLLLAFETDPESEQWQQADELLSRFPGKQRLLDEVRKGLAEEDVDLDAELVPALGDETYLAVLDFEGGGDNVVFLTQPRDEQKFAELLRKSDEPTETRTVDGWTLVAESVAALDRVEAAGDKLEDADWFLGAQERVEGDALVTLYANGAAIHDALRDAQPAGCELSEDFGKLEYAVATLAAESDGVRAWVAAKGDGAQELVSGDSLLSLVPAGAFAYLGSPGFDTERFGLAAQIRCALEAEGGLPDVERELGVSFDDLIDLFAGGFALYLRTAALIPEVTLLLAPEDEARAVETLDKLAEKAAALGGFEVERKRVGEIEARELSFGPVSILYGTGDGRVVVTTTRAGVEALSGEGDKLEDEEGFRSIREDAGVGDGDDVFAYFDLRDLAELVDRFAGFADQDLPPEVEENLEPLSGFIAWGDLSDPNDAEGGAFLAIR